MSFDKFKISDEIKKALELLEYNKATPIQEKIIPLILGGNNLMVKSKTGSGKTAAFSIPLIDMVKWDNKNAQALILSPTRELAMQIREEMFNIGRFKRIKVACIYGKTSFIKQESVLKQRNHIIVATPGRLLDHIERNTVDLGEIKYLVIDEADEMFKMGFIDQIAEIISYLNLKQVILISATMDLRTIEIMKDFSHDAILVQEENSDLPQIVQEYMLIDDKKEEAVINFIRNNKIESAVIFANTQEKVEEVFEFLSNERILVKRLHGGLEQKIRTKTIEEFKEGKIRYLVATDVASRGIDVSKLSYVINYELPSNIKTYIHRIGRTGRMGQEGRSLTLVKNYELDDFIQTTNEHQYDIKEVKNDALSHTVLSDNLMKPLDIIKKDIKLNEEIFTIHINAGKKTKMRASDIVGTLCSLENVSASDIGVISILDISTFVDIMNDKGEYVLNALQDKTIKGRLRVVSKVDRR